MERSDQWNTQTAVSPFRYPGGKGFLSGYLAHVLAERLPGVEAIHFCEPFCGGAGAALNLLSEGIVSHLHLNDADVRIHSAWRAMVEEGDRFIERLMTAPLSMAEWWNNQAIVERGSNDYDFDLGFATFYMNRTTRSGIVEKAGPIGGYDQTGRWKIDARFNRERLAKQVQWLSLHRHKIELSNIDALSFIARKRRVLDLQSTFFFIDPPYVKAGGRLYMNGMTEAKHIALSDILVSGMVPHWLLTYDDAPLIREIYKTAKMGRIAVNYSLQSKRKENEILVLP
ncbi:DNA adenine methylase [Rhizobium ruizarguesonis]|uniref:DNA adenine methylase n=1 Tax=Rhizobium ruizarguesonis TaxID=2081791 RepID=UPI0029620677|nr:DNA adenine methylase [Rhizobium ruizarguesonis]